MNRILPVLLLAAATLTAFAQWSEWQQMEGTGRLSMRSTWVGHMCAFAFRNDSSQTLTSAKIRYYHGGKVDNDLLPALRPGQQLGGWAAFSVEDRCANIRVEVYDQQWR